MKERGLHVLLLESWLKEQSSKKECLNVNLKKKKNKNQRDP